MSCPNCGSGNPRFIYKCSGCGLIFCSNCRKNWSSMSDAVQCPRCGEWKGYVYR